MNKEAVKMLVFFDDPYWIGICERIVDDRMAVCKVTFGAEPKDYEIEDYVLKSWYQLCFSPMLEVKERSKEITNPKRLQREVKKQVARIGIGTKSQQALKLQQEALKEARKTRSKKQKDEENERLFVLKQQKRKEKHKGR